MPPRTVSFDGDPYVDWWTFGVSDRSYDRHTDLLIIHRSDLDLCTATDLQWALRRAEEEGGRSEFTPQPWMSNTWAWKGFR